MITNLESSLESALAYRRRGWRVIPIPPRSKNPGRPGWDKERWEESDLPPLFAQGQNVGVLMGEPSGHLVDVDIDRPEALMLANKYLPPTDATFGRESNPASHRLYVCDTKTKKFTLPAGWAGEGEKDTAVEIRTTGSQTVFPGSVHPEGEPITWNTQGEPAPIDVAALNDAVQRLHAAAVLLFAIGHALRSVPPDCDYDTWIKIGMALHAWDADAGLRLWDEWSSRGAKKYRGLAELETHWKSFREDGAIHLGTLFHIAEEAGWKRLPRLGLYYTAPGAASAPDAEAGPDDWGPVMPFNTAEYGPPLPLEVLPPSLGDFVASVAQSKQVPAELPALLALAAVAACGAKRFAVTVGLTHQEPLNLYGLALLDPGERKSATFAEALGPLYDYEAEQAAAAAPEFKRATEARQLAEARLTELRRKAARADDPADREAFSNEAMELAAALPEVIPPPRLLCGDVTPEALGMLLSIHGGRMMQADPEGGAFFNIVGGTYSKTGATNLDLHLKAHAGDVVMVDRATRGAVAVPNAALTLMLTGQPDLMRRIRSADELRGRGLLARFAFVLPRPMVGSRTYDNIPMDRRAVAAYCALIRSLLAIGPMPDDEPRPLLIAGESWEVWRDYAQRVESSMAEGGELQDLRDWGAKAPGLAARIAGILHLAAGGAAGPISPATVAAAVVCVD